MTEIACPPDCTYLTTSKAHPAAVVRRQRERDGTALVPHLHDLTEAQYHIFLYLLPVVAEQRGVDLLTVTDDDIAEGAAAVAATHETASRGVIYEHRAPTITAQRFAAAVTERLAEPLKSAPRSLERDVALVLRRLERAARDVRKTLGEGNTSFIELVRRVIHQDQRSAEPAAAQPPNEPRLIVP